MTELDWREGAHFLRVAFCLGKLGVGRLPGGAVAGLFGGSRELLAVELSLKQ